MKFWAEAFVVFILAACAALISMGYAKSDVARLKDDVRTLQSFQISAESRLARIDERTETILGILKARDRRSP